MSFGKRLRELRELKELKQEELAKVFNVDRTTLGKWETDSSRPDFAKLNNIANYFDVSTDYLLGRTDLPKISIMENNLLPVELRGKVDAIHIVNDAMKSGLSKETIEEILAIVMKVNEQKK